jgi:hypothetical protein
VQHANRDHAQVMRANLQALVEEIHGHDRAPRALTGRERAGRVKSRSRVSRQRGRCQDGDAGGRLRVVACDVLATARSQPHRFERPRFFSTERDHAVAFSFLRKAQATNVLSRPIGSRVQAQA